MSTVATETPAPVPAAVAGTPFTLAVDIGGSSIKAAVLDCAGHLVAAQMRAPTPKEATPQAVLETIAGLAVQLPSVQRISIGFPGVVKGGKVLTAPNLGTQHWAGFELVGALSQRFGVPARMLNDAAVQGLGVVEGRGLECVLTLGTGVGCAVFRNRRLLLHLELGQHRARRGKTYDGYIGQAALAKKGLQRWNRRVRRAIDTVTGLTSCDVLYIGGGNARKIAFEPPAHVRIVSNMAGLTGGLRLWDPDLDDLFCGETVVQAPSNAGAAMKALTIGGAMVDTIAIIGSDRIERMSMMNADSSFLLLEEGSKIEALEISTHVGGGAVNAAVAMARLGLDVASLVKLGKDARAETVLARLLEEGVSSRWAMRDGRAPTGASVLVSSHDRNAAIFTFRGANTLLSTEDLRKEAFAADLVYVSSLSNESADAFPAIVEQAKAQGALVATNPRVRQLSSRGGAFLDLLAQIDILAVNRNEAGVLVPGLVARFGEGGKALGVKPGEQLPRLAVRGLAGGGHEMSLVGFFAALRRLGPRYVVITDGRHGAFLGSQDAVMYCPVLKTKVAGTAGAGDAFSATFSAYVAMRRPAEEALRAAAINAGSVVGHVDTQTGLLSREGIDKRLAEAKPALEVRIWSH